MYIFFLLFVDEGLNHLKFNPIDKILCAIKCVMFL